MEKLTKTMRVTSQEQEFVLLLRKWSIEPFYIMSVLEEYVNNKKRETRATWEKLVKMKEGY